MAVTSWIRRQFKNAVSTVDYVPSGFSASATSFTAADGSTFPDGAVGDFIVCCDQGLATEEKILCASRSGAVFTVAVNGRGYNGTTAAIHGTNASILHTIDQQDLDEANQTAVATLGQIAAKGDLLVGSAANALVKLAVGSTNQFLQVASGTLAYVSFGTGQSANVGTANADGTQTTPAHSDHVHALTNAVGLTTATYDPATIAMQVLGTTATQTTTNKRITRRVVTVTQTATPAIDTDNMDVASITGLAQAITSMTTSLTGTPVDGDRLEVRITDNGTARAITWGSSFAPSASCLLPTTTVISTLLTVEFEWNATASVWHALYCDAGSPYAAGNLTADYDVTTGQATFLTTASLSVGVWLINCSASVDLGSSQEAIEITVANGTATSTLTGKYSTEQVVGGSLGNETDLMLTFVATVTVAGTLVFQAKSPATTGTPVILHQTSTSSYGHATGYTALKVA